MRSSKISDNHRFGRTLLTAALLTFGIWVIMALVSVSAAPDESFHRRLLHLDAGRLSAALFIFVLLAAGLWHHRHRGAAAAGAPPSIPADEDRYRNIIETMEEGYFEIDLKGKLTFVNDAFARMVGRTPGQMRGLRTRDYTSTDTATRMQHTLNTIYLTGESQRLGSFDVFRPDGDRLALEISVSQVNSARGRVVGFRGIARDVTANLKVAREKQRLETQLQQARKMEAIGTLASGIAHDFNNIMMGILGNTSLMISKIDPDHPHFEKLKNIEKYVENGSELTQQLLGFARGGKYNVKPTSLRELVEESAQMFGRTKKEIRIHKAHLKETLPVAADRGQIEQVLLNLFVNAWQAMPGGGDIYLLTEDVELDAGYQAPYEVVPGPYVKLSIMDTGVGMDRATRKRIFEPFFTTKEMGRGTGLGLASAYGIIKNHGGYINVYSEKGRGTTFTIYLPASDHTRPPEDGATRRIYTGNETILLVDDEDITMDVGQELLEELGYKVLTARDGRDALAIYRRQMPRIDMVILDMVMPGMGGGATYDELKKLNPEVKVLLASGYSISGEASKILERGCNAFIQKPFNMKQLSEKIRKVLDAVETPC
ncbi:MAG: response regulator [Desulfobacterales bacterium]|nr:response regulator [Desulfobacterales bacterium]